MTLHQNGGFRSHEHKGEVKNVFIYIAINNMDKYYIFISH